MLDYKYSYLIGSLISLLVWIYFFVKRKDLRKEMMILSLFTMLLAPTNILYYGSYWKPEFVFDLYNFGIESIIVCFSYGGVAGVVYEYFFRRTPFKLKSINLQISKIQLITSFLLGVVSILGLELFTDLNVIYTTSTGMLVMGIIFVYYRNDLFVPSIVSALITTVIAIVVYWVLLIPYPEFFDRFWIPDTITNLRPLLVPIEEYYFHIALGFSIGVMYEVESGKSDRKLSTRSARLRKVNRK